MERLRLALMGTPDFAVPSLDALLAAGHDVVAVYTQPPRPAGRGKHPRPSPVQTAAENRGILVRVPESLKDAATQADFRDLNADVAIVAAYGLILPRAILAATRLGCINVHASLLPRWRGSAPIQRAILAGDDETGVTIMMLEAGLDTGPILLQAKVPITPKTTASALHDELASLGAGLLQPALRGLAAGTLRPAAQPTAGVTYAAKIGPEEGRIDWRRSAAEIERQVRALNASPGVWFDLTGERIRVLGGLVVGGEGPPGTVLDDRLKIACGDAAIRIEMLQRAGKTAMSAADFLRGNRLPVGTILA